MKVRKLYKDVDHYNIVWFGVQKVEKECYGVLTYSYDGGRYSSKNFLKYDEDKLTNEVIYIDDEKKLKFVIVLNPSYTYNTCILYDYNSGRDVAVDQGIYEIDEANHKLILRLNFLVEPGSFEIYDKINDETIDNILDRKVKNSSKPEEYSPFVSKKLINSYSDDVESIRNNLIQRLSVIQGELWFRSHYGIPLTTKVRNKGILDSIIVSIITECPGVKGISEFKSTIDSKNGYSFSFVVKTFDDKKLEIDLKSV